MTERTGRPEASNLARGHDTLANLQVNAVGCMIIKIFVRALETAVIVKLNTYRLINFSFMGSHRYTVAEDMMCRIFFYNIATE